MKGKQIWVLGFLLVFGFVSFSCFAQSSNNDQRIIGTWVHTSKGETITLVFNADGSGTLNGFSAVDETFTYGISFAGSFDSSFESTSSSLGTPYFSPNGRTMRISLYRGGSGRTVVFQKK